MDLNDRLIAFGTFTPFAGPAAPVPNTAPNFFARCSGNKVGNGAYQFALSEPVDPAKSRIELNPEFAAGTNSEWGSARFVALGGGIIGNGIQIDLQNAGGGQDPVVPVHFAVKTSEL